MPNSGKPEFGGEGAQEPQTFMCDCPGLIRDICPCDMIRWMAPESRKNSCLNNKIERGRQIENRPSRSDVAGNR
jgi:hypothetical protein